MTASELAELTLLIEKARHKKMTQEEIIAQRINWAICNAPEGLVITEADLKEVLEVAKV